MKTTYLRLPSVKDQGLGGDVIVFILGLQGLAVYLKDPLPPRVTSG